MSMIDLSAYKNDMERLTLLCCRKTTANIRCWRLGLVIKCRVEAALVIPDTDRKRKKG